MITKDTIQKLRESIIANPDRFPKPEISGIVISERDIHGGNDFEETLASYRADKSGWLRNLVTEETIQPAYGPTITKARDRQIDTLSDESFLSAMQSSADLKSAVEKLLTESDIAI